MPFLKVSGIKNEPVIHVFNAATVFTGGNIALAEYVDLEKAFEEFKEATLKFLDSINSIVKDKDRIIGKWFGIAHDRKNEIYALKQQIKRLIKELKEEKEKNAESKQENETLNFIIEALYKDIEELEKETKDLRQNLKEQGKLLWDTTKWIDKFIKKALSGKNSNLFINDPVFKELFINWLRKK